MAKGLGRRVLELRPCERSWHVREAVVGPPELGGVRQSAACCGCGEGSAVTEPSEDIEDRCTCQGQPVKLKELGLELGQLLIELKQPDPVPGSRLGKLQSDLTHQIRKLPVSGVPVHARARIARNPRCRACRCP
jgi:hypothetical protein